MISYLEFEKPVAALEARIAELRAASEGEDVDISNELRRLETKSADLLVSTYQALTPWQKTQVARHPARPHFCDYVEMLFEDFVPLGGDRHFGEDEAILAHAPQLLGALAAESLQLFFQRVAKRPCRGHGIAMRTADRFADDPIDDAKFRQILRRHLHRLGCLRGFFGRAPEDRGAAFR